MTEDSTTSKGVPKQVRALAQALRAASGDVVPWDHLDKATRDRYLVDAKAIADAYRSGGNISGRLRLDLDGLRDVRDDLRKYADGCVEAREWGGPTMYPTNPIGESRARQVAKLLTEALGDV
jgi:hypothetical protein